MQTDDARTPPPEEGFTLLREFAGHTFGLCCPYCIMTDQSHAADCLWRRAVAFIAMQTDAARPVPSGDADPPRELLCMKCQQEYPVWFAPNNLWNRVVRRPDGSDEWPFLCPTCFATLAVERGEQERFVVSLAAPATPEAP